MKLYSLLLVQILVRIFTDLASVNAFQFSTLSFSSIRHKFSSPFSNTRFYGTGFGKSAKPSSSLPENSIQQTQKKQRNADKSSNGNDKVLNDSKIIPSIQDCQTTFRNHCPTLNINFSGLRQIHGDPPVYEIDNFFTEEMCHDYINRSQRKGYEISSQTFQGNTLSTRTSTTWYMTYDQCPEFLNKTHELIGLPIQNFEEFQIVRYEFGQQFTWHYDYIPKPSQDDSGNRLCTLLVYLNDVRNGGSTCFKDLNLQIKPKTGKALLFFPCYKDGKLDERTLHAGQVAMDTKWIAQIWIHERNYLPKIPPGNNHADGIKAMELLV